MLQGWGGTAQAGIHQTGTSEASWRGHACSLGSGGSQRMGMQIEIDLYTRGLKAIGVGDFTRTHTLSHKSTKPIASFTKQTGSIKTDNPTNSKRQGYKGQRTFLQTHSDAHIKPGLNSSIQLKTVSPC